MFETPKPRWDTLAGRVLDDFFAQVANQLPNYRSPLTVLGSTPIQLCLDAEFASADVDVMVFAEVETLRRLAHTPSSERGRYHVQVCPPSLFIPSPHYLQRAHMEIRHGLQIVIPHLMDILLAKLHRSRVEGQSGLVAKDLRAFRKVRQMLDGNPSSEQMVAELQNCEAHLRTPLDGTLNSFKLNVLDLFEQVYGRTLNIAAEIAVPQPPPIEIAELGLDQLDPVRP